MQAKQVAAMKSEVGLRARIQRAMLRAIPVAALLLSLGLAGLALLNDHALHSSLPQYEGRFAAPQLMAGSVRIVRDSYGVPHVFSENNEEEVYFGMGYAVASDRLFQMDVFRRVVRGKLAQVFGESALPADRLFRTLMAPAPLDELARGLHPAVAACMQAYANGVNAFLETQPAALPPEFRLLGYEPEPWGVTDSLAIQFLMAWDLNLFVDLDFLRTAVVERVGAELASELFGPYPVGYPVTVPDQHASSSLGLPLMRAFAQARQVAGLRGPGASNGWVVSPQRSVTGTPVLANDMHLGHALPGTWYEVHLVSPEHNAYGVTIPGAPFVVVGTNQHGVAWGFTAGSVDDCDFYEERFHPQDPTRVQTRDPDLEQSYDKLRFQEERIAVKGRGDEVLRIRLTRHGPIVSDLAMLNAPSNRAISMRWAGTEPSRSPLGLYQLNRARSARDALAAARHFKSPGLNWVFADREGNIGYVLAAAIPIRHGFDGSVVLPGWDGRHEWAGFVPFSAQPQVLNPPEGFVVTANNKVVGPGYPHSISHTFGMPDRATRIRRMLEQKPKHSVEDFRRMQADQYMLLAEEWTPILLETLELCSRAPAAQRMLEQLRQWDYIAGAQGVAPTVFHAILNHVVQRTFRQRLGDQLYERWVDKQNYNISLKALRRLMLTPHSAWFDDPTTPRVETRTELLCAAFEDARRSLSRSLGNQVANWQWGKLHRLTLYHQVGRFLQAAPWYLRFGAWAVTGLSPARLNRGRWPMPGSFATVNPAPYPIGKPWGVTAGASQRMIVDLADPSRSLTVLPAGNSGHPASPHYDDQLRLWRQGEYRPLVLDPTQVERDKRHEMWLTPLAEGR